MLNKFMYIIMNVKLNPVRSIPIIKVKNLNNIFTLPT